MSWAGLITRQQVTDLKTFSDFARQTAGIPYPTKAKWAAAQKAANNIFDKYPHLTWQDLVGIIDWAKAKKRRFPQVVGLLNSYDLAWSDGFLPALDPESEAAFSNRILDAIAEETDPVWRERLLKSYGEGSQIVWAEWKRHNQGKEKNDR